MVTGCAWVRIQLPSLPYPIYKGSREGHETPLGRWKVIISLTGEEYGLLESSILAEGCRDSLVVWDGQDILLDGHNRYEICQKHGIAFDVIEKTFGSRYEAINWIINNQLGRRNVSEEQKRYLIGRKYQEEKKEVSNPSGTNRYAKEVGGNCCHQLKTRERVAQEVGASPRTVQDAAAYAAAVDTIASNVGEETKMDILSGKTKLTMKEVKEIC